MKPTAVVISMLKWPVSVTLIRLDTLCLAKIWRVRWKLTFLTLMLLSLLLPLWFWLIKSQSQSGSIMSRMWLQDRFHLQWKANSWKASRLTGRPNGLSSSTRLLTSLTQEGNTFMKKPNYTLVKAITQILSATQFLTAFKLHRLKVQRVCTWCLIFRWAN